MHRTVTCDGKTLTTVHSTVVGNGNTVMGAHNTVIGNDNMVTGAFCKARGDDNVVTGAFCKATGARNRVIGFGSGYKPKSLDGPSPHGVKKKKRKGASKSKGTPDDDTVVNFGVVGAQGRGAVGSVSVTGFAPRGVNKKKRGDVPKNKGTLGDFPALKFGSAYDRVNTLHVGPGEVVDIGDSDMVFRSGGDTYENTGCSSCVVGLAQDGVFKMRKGSAVRAQRAEDVEVVVRREGGADVLRLRGITSASGFALDGTTFSCEDVRIEDGVLRCGGRQVDLDLFSLGGEIAWDQLRELARSELAEARKIDGEDVETDDREKECVVCQANEKRCAMQPCGHKCLCIACANKQLVLSKGASCPICRRTADSIVKIYD